MGDMDCVCCDGLNGIPNPGKENCPLCEEVLTLERLSSEARAMERDEILTEEDALHGSNTGC